jgi:hypothetical protein
MDPGTAEVGQHYEPVYEAVRSQAVGISADCFDIIAGSAAMNGPARRRTNAACVDFRIPHRAMFWGKDLAATRLRRDHVVPVTQGGAA